MGISFAAYTASHSAVSTYCTFLHSINPDDTKGNDRPKEKGYGVGQGQKHGRSCVGLLDAVLGEPHRVQWYETLVCAKPRAPLCLRRDKRTITRYQVPAQSYLTCTENHTRNNFCCAVPGTYYQVR